MVRKQTHVSMKLFPEGLEPTQIPLNFGGNRDLDLGIVLKDSLKLGDETFVHILTDNLKELVQFCSHMWGKFQHL